jgi:outer membrane protein TolC
MRTIVLVVATLTLLYIATAQAASVTLRDCLARAAAANSVLKVAAYDEQIAAESINVANSGYLPRIDLQAGYIAQREPQSVKFGPNKLTTQQADFGFLNLSLYETLYDFGRTASRRQQAVFAKEAVHHGYRGQEQDVFLQVVRAYYGLLEGGKILAATEEEVKQMSAHQRVAQNFYDQGVVTRNDLLQAEVKLANSKQKRLVAANNVDNGWLLLNYLTGQSSGNRGDLDELVEREELADEKLMIEIALRKRPDIAALKKNIETDEALVKESKSGYYPELFAKLALDYVQNNKVEEQAIMAATIGFKVNLYDGLATSSHLRQAVKIRGQDEERLRELEAKIRLDLQTALNDLNVARAQIAVTEQAIGQSEENLRINTDRYLEKVGTATEVIDAQTLLTQTKTAYFRSVYDYQLATARVKKVLGEL